MGAIMAEHKDEFTLFSSKHGEDGLPRHGVVVCLASHRRWRARHCLGPGNFPDNRDMSIEDECWRAMPPATGERGDLMTQEPSLWLAGLVALISFALIVGLYWGFAAGLTMLLRFTVAQF